MSTVYIIQPPNAKPVDLNLQTLRMMLPASMSLDQRDDGLFVTVESSGTEDERTQPLIDRELDRVFFLTCVRLRAEMCRRSATGAMRGSWSVHGQLPAGKGPLHWTDTLTLQLRLWALASGNHEFALKVILLFQIVELSYPNTNDIFYYPKYIYSTTPPHPRTESKLLRHIVAHAGTPRPETQAYLRHLQLREVLSSYHDSQWEPNILARIPIVEREAAQILRGSV